MAAMSNYLENKIIDATFRGVAFTPAATLYVALFTADPTDVGTLVEVGATTANGYTRVAVTSGVAQWAATNGATTVTNPSSGTSGTTSNNAIIQFPTPSAGNWFNGAGPAASSITHFAIMDSATIGAGNVYFFGALTNPKTVNLGDAGPSFAISSLSVQIDN
jgi:hypothetical protein